MSVECKRSTLPFKRDVHHFDVSVDEAEILHVPMKLGLEFVPVISAVRGNAEWELLYDIVDEVDGVPPGCDVRKSSVRGRAGHHQ